LLDFFGEKSVQLLALGSASASLTRIGSFTIAK
jgi:hypothetical protein